MTALKSYGSLFSLTGAVYVVVAFIARLPLAMSQIASLLAVAGTTGSYGAGGATAGAMAVANAIGAPIAGGLTDRIGQRWVLTVQAVLGTVGLAVLGVLVDAHTTGEPWWPLMMVAILAGLFIPQVGTMARVRWRPISTDRGSRDPRVMDAAFSYEGAADEASFVLGPALVGLVVALLNPVAALLLAAGMLGLFGLWFALHPTGLLVRPSGAAATSPARLLTPALVTLALIQFSVGMVFGSVQTGTSVLATQAGEPGLTGFLHGLLGVGSVLAGLLVVMLPDSLPYPRRLQFFTVPLFLLSLPLLLVDSLTALAVVLLILGVAIAPSMITTFTVAERSTPIRRLGAAMTVMAALTGVGYATGSSIAGQLADLGGHRPAFMVSVAATALAMLLAVTAVGRLTRAMEREAARRGRPVTAAEPSGVEPGIERVEQDPAHV